MPCDYFSPMPWGQMPLRLGALLGEIDSGLRAAIDLQFLEDVLEVMSDGLVAQGQRDGDFFIGLSFGDQG